MITLPKSKGPPCGTGALEVQFLAHPKSETGCVDQSDQSCLIARTRCYARQIAATLESDCLRHRRSEPSALASSTRLAAGFGPRVTLEPKLIHPEWWFPRSLPRKRLDVRSFASDNTFYNEFAMRVPVFHIC